MGRRIITPRKNEEMGIIKHKKKMMPFKAFFILSVLLCSLIIQPSMAARDLAHDAQTKVDAQKAVDAAISYHPLRRKSRPCSKRYYRCGPPSRTP